LNTSSQRLIGSSGPWRLPKACAVYFGQCLQAALLYRAALAIFILSEAFAYAGFIAFWHKAATVNPAQTIYKPMALVLYFALASFHHGIQHHASSRDVGGDIRLGKLSYTIIRPFPFLLQALLRSMAFTLTYAVLLSPLLTAALVWVPGLWTEFASGLEHIVWWQYPVALALGLMCGWLIRIAVGLFAFDMSQIWGPDTFFIAVYFAASGAVFPVDLLPLWAMTLVKWTPMYYMVGFPVLTLMGRIPPDQFTEQALQGGVVALCTMVMVSLMWLRGIKKFEAIGI
jgi:ABC-2 type transport system permease protein